MWVSTHGNEDCDGTQVDNKAIFCGDGHLEVVTENLAFSLKHECF